MKHFFSLASVFFFTFFSLRSNGQPFNSPVEYLNAINTEYQLIAKDSWGYMKAAAHSRSARKIENRRSELLITTQNSRKKIAKLPPYEGNRSLRDSIASYLNITYLILKEDYAKIIDLEEIAEQSYDLMEAYMLTVQETDKKREQAYTMVENEFDKFVKEFNINFSESDDSKLGKKLIKAAAVYDYYNPIYLIFFKSYKQEYYLIESLNNNDMVAFEQNRNALVCDAEEGLEKIRITAGYGTDLSIKRACQQLLLFYQNEANEKAPYYADFYLKKENMEKLKEAIESKPKSKLTNEEIDAYNQSIKDYNEALDTFNKVNKEINNQREKHLDAWNKASKTFIDTHVP